MNCPQCGAENRNNANFCKNCGKTLKMPDSPLEGEKQCPHCCATLRAEARFCKQCGQAIPETSTLEAPLLKRCCECGAHLRPGARFCPKCGITLTHPVQYPTGPTCMQCGTQIRPGARFCKQCGAPILAAGDYIGMHGHHPTPDPPLNIKNDPKRYYSPSGHLLPREKISDRYLIVEKIAEGGMGAIYRAKDLRLHGKTIALKEMSEEKIPVHERPKVLQAFEREAELLARLLHTNLTRVTDRFKEQGRYYMVMEFIEGKTLDELLESRSKPFSEDQVLNWARQLCEALSFLHNQKPQPIIYRDIKPGNIMIVQDTDRVKLIDFGIARIYKPHKKKDTIPFGTEGYAPPEQYGKAQTDARADIYALGATLHQLLTLEEPRTNLMNLPPVRKLNRNVSQRVAEAIDKAVDMDKRKRHQSMAEMWEALSGKPPGWTHLASPSQPLEEAKSQSKTPPRSKISIDPDPTSPGASEPKIIYGEITTSQRGMQLIYTLHFKSGERVKLKSEADWIKLSSNKIGSGGGDVTLTIETSHLEPSRLELKGNVFTRWIGWHTAQLVPIEHTHLADVLTRTTSGKERRCTVAVQIKPTLGQQVIGWLSTIAVIIVELGAAGGVVATLLSAVGLL